MHNNILKCPGPVFVSTLYIFNVIIEIRYHMYLPLGNKLVGNVIAPINGSRKTTCLNLENIYGNATDIFLYSFK